MALGILMTIEEIIFNRTNVDFTKLPGYGFIKFGDRWIYTKNFMNDEFRAEISIDKLGNISGDVYETDSDDIYFPLRIESMAAGFAGQVRHEYENILLEIQKQCCRVNYFIFPQANRLVQKIYDTYGDGPTFPWDKFDGYGVFRNPDSDKWYALVMNINKNKLNKNLSGMVEVVNIKLDENKIVDLLKQKGFYPAYHMNKKNWISIVLDDTLSDNLLFSLLEESHSFTLGKRKKRNTGNNAWLIPANPKFFDIEAAFNKHNEIIWKQSNNIQVDDVAYMYVGAPISAILYKCKVTEVDIDYNYQDKNLKIRKVMKIKLLKKYNKNLMPFHKLCGLGVKTIRGPRLCPNNLIYMLE